MSASNRLLLLNCCVHDLLFADSLSEIILLVLRKWLQARLYRRASPGGLPSRRLIFFATFPFSMIRNRPFPPFPHDRDCCGACMLELVRMV